VILARPIAADRREDLRLAVMRLALPSSAGDYVLEKLVHVQLLLTGLDEPSRRFLRRAAQAEAADSGADAPTFVPGDPKRAPGTAVLGGRLDRLERIVRECRSDDTLHALAEALREGLRALDVPAPTRLGNRTFSFGERTYVMGVVNVTPDSFSDGGRFESPDKAIAQGLALVEAGADVLDIGGESTRPGAPALDPDEELRRVLPVLEGLRRRCDVPLSIDTRKSKVAREAIAAGASLVNDVSGFHFDAEMASVVAKSNAACALMHILGTPETMQKDPRYGDVVEDVIAYLREGIARAVSAGIAREQIWVDPGIGFGKTPGHNLFLLRRLADLRILGAPVLVGTSRKSFLGAVTGGKPVGERLSATLGSLASMAALGGADIVRVHDVQQAKEALAVADAIRLATEGGDQFSRHLARGQEDA
jgi:dihydropteroate synthase